MNVFNPQGALHFCSNFQIEHAASASLLDYAKKLHAGILSEGSGQFNEVRAHLIRDVDRSLLLAASQYRRAHDLMMTSSASWSYVTLYYGAFYSAKALLGMFGGWVDAPYIMIEVSKTKPGSQELSVHRHVGGSSHQRLWIEFYDAFSRLKVHIDSSFHFAIEPISGVDVWLTSHRNDYNYDTYKAFQVAGRFDQSFNTRSFPACLAGELNTQYQVTRDLVTLAFSLANHMQLSTDALDVLGKLTTRNTKIKKMVFNAVPPHLKASVKKVNVLI